MDKTDKIIVPGRVSLVVASYNHAGFLNRRMDSLIAQTYEDIEIVVIDDCSPDNSVDILRDYEDHPKVNLIIRKENGGWVTVSNQGIDVSTGEYVLFANCDDSCGPTMVERLVAAMQSSEKTGIAFCRSYMVDENDAVLGDDFTVRSADFRAYCAADVVIPKDQANRFLLHSCVIPNLSACLFRRQCFEDHGNLSAEYRVCCDWDLFFRIAQTYDISYVATALNNFRQHRKTIRSVTKDKVVYEEYFRLLLGQVNSLNLSARERMSARTHVMYLWAVHVLVPSRNSWVNIPYHLRCVLIYDPASIVFLIPGFLKRVLEIGCKATGKMLRILKREATQQ
ncbi:Glycosyl transferase family 2 [Cohaesibacter gelatinilyticus]|uniref:Glycosyl transferase family 2 n=2 Tax=Cohaesibacter gelatinilyticus TaxID=372072 RepID=A0A285PFS9_9HYPH|nr:Glycosyl transferase family 2 [Cohaesibacter gelatinilyticus]